VGYFRCSDELIDEHAGRVGALAALVYVCLARHVNESAETFVGYRTIARKLGISKTTVTACIKKLEAYHLLVRCPPQRGKVSQLRLLCVPDDAPRVYQPVVRKEDSKEFKEVQVKEYRDQLGRKFVRA
jgi:predicted transcriptional regulator